jgi:type IV pilus assembly protein PilN
MLIDINLLPKQEKQSPIFLGTVVGLIAVSLVISVLLYVNYQNLLQSKNHAEQELEMTRQLIAIEQEKLNELGATGAATKLEDMITWLEQVPVSSVEIIAHLTERLPAKGYFQTINYGDIGSVTLTAQFDTLFEASSYLYQMQQSAWVGNVELQSVSSSEQEDGKIEHYEANYTIDLNISAIKANQKEAN